LYGKIKLKRPGDGLFEGGLSMKTMKIRFISCLLIIVLSALLAGCSPGQSSSGSDKSAPAPGLTTIIHTTAGTGEINADQAIAIAKLRFDEYLSERPEVKIKDPGYTAQKKAYKDNTPYWSVTLEIKEPEYQYWYFEVQISMNGEKITLQTG